MPDGWDPDKIIMRNQENTAGIIGTGTALDVFGSDAQSVLLDAEYLRDALDVATNLHDGFVWMSVETDKPVVFTPHRSDVELASVVVPRVLPDTTKSKYNPTSEGDSE